jgi:hypothetical protein
MPGLRRILGLALVAAAVIATAAACGNDDRAADFAGHWTSRQWGEHYIVVDGSTMKIIYTHDNGRVAGTLDGATFTGWWTETPSRQAPRDAGTVEFTVSVTNGERKIDGKWRYGTDGNLREDWDLTWVGAEIPAEIAAKFDEAALFTGRA